MSLELSVTKYLRHYTKILPSDNSEKRYPSILTFKLILFKISIGLSLSLEALMMKLFKKFSALIIRIQDTDLLLSAQLPSNIKVLALRQPHQMYKKNLKNRLSLLKNKKMLPQNQKKRQNQQQSRQI